MIKVINKKTSKVIASNVELASTFKDRLVGLMFSKSLGTKDGLLLKTNSIHTCFMNYPIDVIFINKDSKVIKMIKSMKPWRLTRIYFSAVSVLELAGNSIPSDLNEGDQLEILNV